MMRLRRRGKHFRTCVYGAHSFWTNNETARVCSAHRQANQNFERRTQRLYERLGVRYLRGSR